MPARVEGEKMKFDKTFSGSRGYLKNQRTKQRLVCTHECIFHAEFKYSNANLNFKNV